jgi:hypothetical protein
MKGKRWTAAGLAVSATIGLLIAAGTTAFAGGTEGVWSEGPDMVSGHMQHTATLLLDGRVLVAGGRLPENSATTSAEIYEPGSNSWSPAAPMLSAHGMQTATLLGNGNALIANGIGADGHTTSDTEVYDPSANQWRFAGNITRRYLDAAVALPDGGAMVMGGLNLSGLVNDSEIYNPSTNSWHAAARMNQARDGFAAVTLQDGSVLVAGGNQDMQTPMASVEIYDRASNRWRMAAPMLEPRMYFAAQVLQSGKVLVAGGGNDDVIAEVYDPNSNTWSATGATVNRYEATLTLLADGRVLWVGGGGNKNTAPDEADIYDPSTNNWSSVYSPPPARWDHTATLLRNGHLLLAGGDPAYQNTPVLASTLIYDPNGCCGWDGGGIGMAGGAQSSPLPTASASSGVQPATQALPEVPAKMAAHQLQLRQAQGSWPVSPFLLAIVAGCLLGLAALGGLGIRALRLRRRGI